MSTGVKAIRKTPAIIDPPAALIITGNFLVDSKESINVKNRVLAKVSPNLDKGPYIKAGAKP